ncbi:MAG: hypothetical protein LLG09_05880 [Negativicutes bacterium]|nr:hypothetical protein [Negativicutes bacterium]
MKEPYSKEIELKAQNGMFMLIFSILLTLAGFAAIGVGALILTESVRQRNKNCKDLPADTRLPQTTPGESKSESC